MANLDRPGVGEPIEVTEPALLIRIPRFYRRGMSAQALYEATRGVWKVGQRREVAKFAFAVFEGLIMAVYEIESWHPAGSTVYTTRHSEEVRRPGRWEFCGREAGGNMAAKYVGRSVASCFPRGQQNPVVYVNC